EDGVTNATFVQGDSQIYPFEPGAFDVAISRTGAMFFGNPVAAFSNISRALRAGGRLVLLAWKPLVENAWLVEWTNALAAARPFPPPPADAPGPFPLSKPHRVRTPLTSPGFGDVTLEAFHEPIWFGDHADDAYRFVTGMGFSQFLLRDLDDAARTEAL